MKHPSVCEDESLVDRLVHTSHDPYQAMSGSHAIIVCTEWDEFKVSCLSCTIGVGGYSLQIS